MCKINVPKPDVPVADLAPDFADEQVALAAKIQQQDKKRVFAGLSSTIKNGPQGVTAKVPTT